MSQEASQSEEILEKGSTSQVSLGKSLVFTGLTLALLFATAEVVLRAFEWVSGNLPPTANRSLYNEWGWVQPFLNGEKSRFMDNFTRFDPLLGHSLKPGWSGNDVKNGTKITVNSLGFRSTREIAKEKAAGERRLLCLGDSFTFGYMVEDEYAYPQILERKYLPDWTVINAAVPGYGIDQQVLLYEDRGHAVDPDIVMLGFFSADMSRNTVWFYMASKPYFTVEEGELELHTEKVRSATDILHEYQSGENSIQGEGSYVVRAIERKFMRISRNLSADDSADWEITDKLLDRFDRNVRANGSQPFLLIIPDKEVLKTERNRTFSIVELLVEKARQLEMPYLDLTPVYQEWARTDQRPLFLRELDGHFSKEAADLTAAAIRDSLEDWGLLEDETAPSE